MTSSFDIVVLIPCYNEAATIVDVVTQFKKVLPNCTLYVYDNASTDNTASIAMKAGAVVKHEENRGKGNVVRRMFADIDADIYVMVDGDNTYDANRAPELIQVLIDRQLDMVVGSRQEKSHVDKNAVYRFGHRIGNQFFSYLIAKLFGRQFQDVFSGYRVFSRRFVKSFPAMSHGFDIETELTIHSLELRLPTAEIPTAYGARPQGSTSKLNSYKDGFKILMRIFLLLKSTRPLLFFTSIFIVLFMISILLFTPVFIDYLHTGLVARFPTAIFSASVMLLAFLSLGCGLILDNVCHARREMKRLFYLGLTRFKR